MSNKEKCLKLLDHFSEDQLANILPMLESARALAEEAADDAYCMRLYAEYQTKTDKDEGKSIEDIAKELGIAL